jgi:hypothetical protein
LLTKNALGYWLSNAENRRSLSCSYQKLFKKQPTALTSGADSRSITDVKLPADSSNFVGDSPRSLFQAFHSCSKYNSMSSIQWCAQTLHSPNYSPKNPKILIFFYWNSTNRLEYFHRRFAQEPVPMSVPSTI